MFGGPRWRDLVGPEAADGYVKTGAVPVMLDPDGVPVKRNFVHVDDLCAAILAALDNPRARQQTFNICMDEPVDYGALGAYLNKTRKLPSGADPDALPIDLARQHQGEVSARLAAALRSGPPDRRRLRLQARARRSAQGLVSGMKQ